MFDYTIRKCLNCFYPKNFSDSNVDSIGNDLIFILSGSGNMTIDGVVYPYTKGDVFLNFKDHNHDYTAYKKTEYIWISFYGTIDKSLLKSGCYSGLNNKIFDIFKCILDQYNKKSYLYDQFCSIHIAEILYELSITLKTSSTIGDIYSLLQYIDHNKITTMSISEMAQLTNYSCDYFRHKFKSITGMSPKEYLIDKRLHHARALLDIGSYSCTQVANMCNFSNSSQFSMQFKVKYGLSPKDYLNKK